MVDLKSATKRMLDLSTAHITKKDAQKMNQASRRFTSDGRPRIQVHAHGYIVFVSSEPDALLAARRALTADGYSEAFLAIYMGAAELGGDVMLINFDEDADQVDGLPTFDW